MSAPFGPVEAALWPDLNALRDPPQVVPIPLEAVPARWSGVCRMWKLRLNCLILYKNRAKTGKLWPASAILVRGVSRGDHRGADTVIDSSSGGYIMGLLAALEEMRERGIDFPIKYVVGVVPRSLPSAKRKRLLDLGVTELYDADNSAEAMVIAERLAKEKGWWYTGQYWNDDNCVGWIRPAQTAAALLPNLGLASWGLGSSGGVTGGMPQFVKAYAKRNFGVRRVGCILERGHKLGGVRDPENLALGSDRWTGHLDEVRFITSERARAFCQALWLTPEHGCIGGESTGFAAEGAMLAVEAMIILQQDARYRGPDGYLEILFPAVDDRSPYQKDFEDAGITLPQSEWDWQWEVPAAV